MGSSPITGAVEGDLDGVVLERIVRHVGREPGPVYGRKGKLQLLTSLGGYNNAARFAPWLVLIDLDRDCDCPPPCRKQWLPEPAPLMCFRIAVRAVEAWLLADRERIAGFLGLSAKRVPTDPDRLSDPKATLIELAKGSRRGAIRQGLVPRPESGRRIGPEYNALLSQFVSDQEQGWRPDVAACESDSLQRCLARLGELRQQL